MKLGARRPFHDGGAGLSVLRQFVQTVKEAKNPLKIHLVGHSTGAILHAYLAAALAGLEPTLRVASASLLAPAATVDLFRTHYRPLLNAKASAAGIDRMDIYNLSDKLELDDNVIKVYRKSLLYLVSRSFEEDPLPAGILGMDAYCNALGNEAKLSLKTSHGRVAGSKESNSESHGGFDNDPLTMNTVLRRVLGKKPAVPFTSDSLRY
ncbi:MAG: hypothetical protein RLN69_08875, partial [Woeseiaceae bacterium]